MKKIRDIVQIVSFYIIFPIGWLIAWLPLFILYWVADILFILVYYVFGYRKKVVFENLHSSFPQKNDKEIEDIARKFYRYFTTLIVEVFKSTHLTDKQLSKRIKIRNPEVFENLRKRNKHAIVVMGHYGNWEWLTGIIRKLPHRAMSVYKPLNNKYFNNFVVNLRSSSGAELVPMRQVPKAMIRYQQDGIPTVSLFMADQSPMRDEIQYWTKFLNQDTPVYVGVEKLAKKYNQAVVFMAIHPIKRGYYEIELIELFDDVTDIDTSQITEAHVRALEKVIVEAPQYWLWSHRRWKLSHLKPDSQPK